MGETSHGPFSLGHCQCLYKASEIPRGAGPLAFGKTSPAKSAHQLTCTSSPQSSQALVRAQRGACKRPRQLEAAMVITSSSCPACPQRTCKHVTSCGPMKMLGQRQTGCPQPTLLRTKWAQISEVICPHCCIAILVTWMARGTGVFLKDLVREETLRGVSDVVMLLPGFQVVPPGTWVMLATGQG